MQPIGSQLQQFYPDLNSQALIQQKPFKSPSRTEEEVLLELTKCYISNDLLAPYSKYGVTLKDVSRYINFSTNTINANGLRAWLETRISISPEIKHDENGKFNLADFPPVPPSQRIPCKRDLTEFGFPEIPLTEEERQDCILRVRYKFQVHDSIVWIPGKLMDYIQEENLYREDESDIMKRARKSYWGYQPSHLTKEGFQEKQYVEKHYPHEYALIALEMNELRIQAEIGRPLRKRLSLRSFLTPAMQAKLHHIFYMTFQSLRMCWPSNTRLREKVKVTLLFASFNIGSFLILQHFLQKDSIYERR